MIRRFDIFVCLSTLTLCLQVGAHQAALHQPRIEEGGGVFEGSGKLMHDDDLNELLFVMSPNDSDQSAHKFIVMPCRLRETMENAQKNAKASFHLTGTIFVYRNNNYILPTHTAIHTPEEPTPAETATPVDTQPDSSTSSDSADDIIRKLEQATGTLVRSTPVNVNDFVSEAVNQDTMIVRRQGRFARQENGRWIFIFDSDVSGLSDPPMELLPCRMLETIERRAQLNDRYAQAIVSGTVTSYRGKNFLLPTMVQVPKERRNISP